MNKWLEKSRSAQSKPHSPQSLLGITESRVEKEKGGHKTGKSAPPTQRTDIPI